LAVSDAESREQVLKEANTEQAIAVRDLVTRASASGLNRDQHCCAGMSHHRG